MDREFKGVWFPKEVWLDERLSALDKIILIEIDSLDLEDTGCYASNEYLANFCQCSERKVSEAISKLIKCEYIYVESFNGRTRILRSRLSNFARQTSKNCEAESQKLLQNNVNENINIDNKKEIEKEKIEKIYNYYLDKAIHYEYAKTKKNDFNDIPEKQIKAIKKTLDNTDDIESIFQTIDRYFEVITNKNYFFDTFWNVEKFFGQGNAFNDFTEEGSKWVNYQIWKKKQNNSPYSSGKEISRETAYPDIKDKNYW